MTPWRPVAKTDDILSSLPSPQIRSSTASSAAVSNGVHPPRPRPLVTRNSISGAAVKNSRKIYKIVLTGGPCGGKTTAQVRLATFFESLGWKVFTVPETATILLSGRVKFSELSDHQVFLFQRDLLATMRQIEDTFFNQAHSIKDKNVLVICDRGCMDPLAYSTPEQWKKIMDDLKCDEFELKCSRYDQVAHLVTAADGAERFYTLTNNNARSEGLAQAKQLDEKTRSVWVGHPYLDIIDNAHTQSFDDKVNKLIQVVCDRTGVRSGDRLDKNSKKRKWLVLEYDDKKFVSYEEFELEHCYLLADDPKFQIRLRKRTQHGRSTYTLTSREYFPETKESVETRKQLTFMQYQSYLPMRDTSRATIFKKRRCFMVGTQYYNLDIFVDPQPPKARGRRFMFLETFTTVPVNQPLQEMPSFLVIEKEITGHGEFSMYTLSKMPNVKCQSHEFIGAKNYVDD